MAAYRQMRDDPNHPAAADPFGDVFLVIDGWPAFVGEFPDLEAVVQDLAGQGLGVRRAHGDLDAALDGAEVARARLSRHQGRVPARRRQRDTDRPHHPRDPGEPARPGGVDGEAPPDDRRAAARRRAQRRRPRAGDVGGCAGASRHGTPTRRRGCGCCRSASTCTSWIRTRPDRSPTTAPGGRFRSVCASRTCRWPTTTCTRRRTS